MDEQNFARLARSPQLAQADTSGSYAQKLCFEKLKKVAYSFNRKTERKYANEERYSDGTEKARGIS
jgi:hypothetical protein